MGVWCIVASVALVVVVAEGFCVAVAQLATGFRRRAADVAARAEERGRALRAGALVWLEPSLLHRRFLALLIDQSINPHRIVAR